MKIGVCVCVFVCVCVCVYVCVLAAVSEISELSRLCNFLCVACTLTTQSQSILYRYPPTAPLPPRPPEGSRDRQGTPL